MEKEGLRAAKAAGFELLDTEWYSPGTTDFYPLISRLIASKVDVLLASNVLPKDLGLILKQRDELGGNFLVVMWSANPAETMKIAPKASERDHVFRWVEFSSTPKLSGFAERYMKRWNESPMFFSQEGYDFVGVYTQAVQKAGKLDSPSVKASLDDPGFVYEGLMGTYKWGGKSLYGSNCNMYYPIGIAIIKDGKVKNLATVEVSPK